MGATLNEGRLAQCHGLALPYFDGVGMDDSDPAAVAEAGRTSSVAGDAVHIGGSDSHGTNSRERGEEDNCGPVRYYLSPNYDARDGDNWVIHGDGMEPWCLGFAMPRVTKELHDRYGIGDGTSGHGGVLDIGCAGISPECVAAFSLGPRVARDARGHRGGLAATHQAPQHQGGMGGGGGEPPDVCGRAASLWYGLREGGSMLDHPEARCGGIQWSGVGAFRGWWRLVNPGGARPRRGHGIVDEVSRLPNARATERHDGGGHPEYPLERRNGSASGATAARRGGGQQRCPCGDWKKECVLLDGATFLRAAPAASVQLYGPIDPLRRAGLIGADAVSVGWGRSPSPNTGRADPRCLSHGAACMQMHRTVEPPWAGLTVVEPVGVGSVRRRRGRGGWETDGGCFSDSIALAARCYTDAKDVGGGDDSFFRRPAQWERLEEARKRSTGNDVRDGDHGGVGDLDEVAAATTADGEAALGAVRRRRDGKDGGDVLDTTGGHPIAGGTVELADGATRLGITVITAAAARLRSLLAALEAPRTMPLSPAALFLLLSPSPPSFTAAWESRLSRPTSVAEFILNAIPAHLAAVRGYAVLG